MSLELRVERYRDDHRQVWDNFVASSKNGTFLFLRDFMEYHRDRFEDHSLLVFDPQGAPAAVVPANSRDDVLYSHEGLTYGGLVSGPDMKTPTMLAVFDAVLAYCQANGFSRLEYKTIPAIYHILPADEDRYALFIAGAELVRRDVLAVVASGEVPAFQKRRLRSIHRAENAGLQTRRSDDFAAFWKLLEANLATRHEAKPVHSLAEIQQLATRFPDDIRLFACYGGESLLAGTVIFQSRAVTHAQYIGSSEEGRKAGALDLLFHHLLQPGQRERPYFDFGVSNEQQGRFLNPGLIEFKEGFGARAVVHDFYRVAPANWRPGKCQQALTQREP